MRIGLYLGRHAGAGGGMAVYARELVAGLVRLLERAGNDKVELVLYGDERTLDEDLRETIAISSLLSAESDGWDLRTADSYFQPLPNGARCRIVLRTLSSWGSHKAGMIADQLLLPLRMRFDRIQIAHSVANISLLLSPGVRLVTVHDLFQGWPPQDADGKSASSKSDQGPGAPAAGPVQRVYRTVFKSQFRRVNHVVTDVGSVADEISRRFGFDRARISQIALGIDRHVAGLIAQPPDEQAVTRKTRKLREQFDLHPGSVLLLGGLDPRKNLRRSLEAFFQVLDELPDVTLVVRSGERGIEPIVRSIAAGRMDAVRFIPWLERERLPFLLLDSAVLLVPTLAEGYGLPAAEALALGTPVVSGPLEIVRRGELAPHFQCVPTDSKSIASALKQALSQTGTVSERSTDLGRGSAKKEELALLRLEALRRRAAGESRDMPRTLLDTAADTLALYSGLSVRYR